MKTKLTSGAPVGPLELGMFDHGCDEAPDLRHGLDCALDWDAEWQAMQRRRAWLCHTYGEAGPY